MCGNVSDLGCLVFQNPCQGLASPKRQRLAPFPATLRPPWHTPSDACSRRDLDSLAGTSRAHCIFFPFLFCVSSSLHLKFCPAMIEILQRPVPKRVCPSSPWHKPNCRLTGGHTTWGTVSFPYQMEFHWSRRRPTTGLLEQMLCRQSLDSFSSSCQYPTLSLCMCRHKWSSLAL